MAGGLPLGTPHPVSDGIEEFGLLAQVKYLQNEVPTKNGEISSQDTPKINLGHRGCRCGYRQD